MFKLFNFILRMHRENTLYARFVMDLFVYLKFKDQHMPIVYELPDEDLIGEIYALIDKLKQLQNHPND